MERAAPARVKPDTAGVPFPPPLAFVGAFLLAVVIELVSPTSWPTAISIGGAIVCGVVWLVLDGAAMGSFLRSRTAINPFNPSTTLVTSGPYRLTRNPMYVGMAFLQAALAFAFNVVWALATLPIAIVLVDRLVIAREEPYLDRKFGEEYRDYKRRVRRWI